MKKALILTLLLVGVAFGQGNSTVYLNGSSGSADFYYLTNWGAFSSDSGALSFSKSFDVSNYDTLEIWGLGSSTTGVSKWSASLWGGFANTPSATDYDSIGVAIDTTSVKTEVMVRYARLATGGAAKAAIRVSGYNAVSIETPADSKVNLFMVGIRRQFSGNR